MTPAPPIARSAPVLEADRLRLRGHQRGDYPAFSAMWADPEVVRFIGGKPSSAEESWARLVRHVGHWPLLGFGYWAIDCPTAGSSLLLLLRFFRRWRYSSAVSPTRS